MKNEVLRACVWKIRRAMRRFGLELASFNRHSPDFALIDIFERRGITTIVDGGANVGQFASEMRLQGFRGIIHSVEPLPDVYRSLVENTNTDRGIVTHNFALSDKEGPATIYVGVNDQTSSLHKPLANPENSEISKVRDSIEINCKRFDSWLGSEPSATFDVSSTLLKLDVQGHEKSVLDGCGDILAEIPAVLLEVCIVKFYSDETSFGEIVEYMRKKGFGIKGIRGGYHHPEHRFLMQVDVIFENLNRNERALIGLAG